MNFQINLKSKVIIVHSEVTWKDFYSHMKDLWRYSENFIYYNFPIGWSPCDNGMVEFRMIHGWRMVGYNFLTERKIGVDI